MAYPTPMDVTGLQNLQTPVLLAINPNVMTAAATPVLAARVSNSNSNKRIAKKYQGLSKEEAEAKRRKINAQEKDRMDGVTKAFKKLESLLPECVKLEGDKLSKLNILNCAVNLIQILKLALTHQIPIDSQTMVEAQQFIKLAMDSRWTTDVIENDTVKDLFKTASQAQKENFLPQVDSTQLPANLPLANTSSAISNGTHQVADENQNKISTNSSSSNRKTARGKRQNQSRDKKERMTTTETNDNENGHQMWPVIQRSASQAMPILPTNTSFIPSNIQGSGIRFVLPASMNLQNTIPDVQPPSTLSTESVNAVNYAVPNGYAYDTQVNQTICIPLQYCTDNQTQVSSNIDRPNFHNVQNQDNDPGQCQTPSVLGSDVIPQIPQRSSLNTQGDILSSDTSSHCSTSDNGDTRFGDSINDLMNGMQSSCGVTGENNDTAVHATHPNRNYSFLNELLGNTAQSLNDSVIEEFFDKDLPDVSLNASVRDSLMELGNSVSKGQDPQLMTSNGESSTQSCNASSLDDLSSEPIDYLSGIGD